MRFTTIGQIRKRAALGREFAGATLDGIDAKEAVLEGLNFSSTLVRNVDFTRARLNRSTFTNATFQNCQFFEAQLRNANLTGANFDEFCRFRFADLSRARLVRAGLATADLRSMLAYDADLTAARLDYADLMGSSLNNANLKGAYLQGANLRGAVLRRANLRDAFLPSPGMLLLAEWGECSRELAAMLMRLDASAHPRPEAFEEWKHYGPCPYQRVRVSRAAHFLELKSAWEAGPPPTLWEAWSAVRAEHCPDWSEEEVESAQEATV